MIDTCKRCGCPTVRGRCMECPAGGWSWTIGFALAVAILFVIRGCDARAQEPPRLTARARFDVARCLVAERSGHAVDDAPILAVLERRRAVMGMRDIGAAARAYCACFRAAHPSRRQAEIVALPDDPAALRRYHGAWTSALASVDAWQAGTLHHACDGEPEWWGDRIRDARRARRMGWQRVVCPDSANWFWRGSGRAVRADLARGRRHR